MHSCTPGSWGSPTQNPLVTSAREGKEEQMGCSLAVLQPSSPKLAGPPEPQDSQVGWPLQGTGDTGRPVPLQQEGGAKWPGNSHDAEPRLLVPHPCHCGGDPLDGV